MRLEAGKQAPGSYQAGVPDIAGGIHWCARTGHRFRSRRSVLNDAKQVSEFAIVEGDISLITSTGVARRCA